MLRISYLLDKRILIMVAAAIVIFVAAGALIGYLVKQGNLEKLYLEAERALQKGDYKTATEKLDKLLEINPSYKDAKKKLEEARAERARRVALGEGEGVSGNLSGGDGSSPATSNGGNKTETSGKSPGGSAQNNSNGGSTTDSENGSTPESMGANAYMPGELNGYSLIRDVSGITYASRMYKANSTKNKVAYITIVAQQIVSEEVLDKKKQEIERGYPYDTRNLNLKGKKAYFGSDGDSFAMLSWADNLVLIKIEALAANGDPAKLYDEMVNVAKQMP